MTLRQGANRHIEYMASMRNIYVEQYGVWVTVKVPNIENDVDFYGNYIEDATPIEIEAPIAPLYDRYYQLMDVLGTEVESELPLECIIRTTDDIKVDSTFELQIETPTAENEIPPDEDQVREWRVTKIEYKHLEEGYSKIAFCVPSRAPRD